MSLTETTQPEPATAIDNDADYTAFGLKHGRNNGMTTWTLVVPLFIAAAVVLTIGLLPRAAGDFQLLATVAFVGLLTVSISGIVVGPFMWYKPRSAVKIASVLLAIWLFFGAITAAWVTWGPKLILMIFGS